MWKRPRGWLPVTAEPGDRSYPPGFTASTPVGDLPSPRLRPEAGSPAAYPAQEGPVKKFHKAGFAMNFLHLAMSWVNH